MTKFVQADVVRFVSSARENGVQAFYVTDYTTMKEIRGARHLRKGAIPLGEGKGRKVRAYGLDEVGNFVALCNDGVIRQFLGV